MDTVQPEDGRRILAFAVREHPRTPDVMTRVAIQLTFLFACEENASIGVFHFC